MTNIAQDVVEDAHAGGRYLPVEWLDEADLTVERLPDPGYFAASKKLAERLLEYSEQLYTSGETGLSVLPENCLWGISSALSIYRDIGRGIQKATPANWANRVSTSPARKLRLPREAKPPKLSKLNAFRTSEVANCPPNGFHD